MEARTDRVQGEPRPEDELQFLGKVRALLGDGAFVSTYKFALLRALASECIEREETPGILVISKRRLGERFIELYWRQARPYRPLVRERAGGPGGQLLQSTGKQATIIKLLSEAQGSHPLLTGARSDPAAWRSLTSKVSSVVTRMPLYKLQTMAGRKVCFLYRERRRKKHIELLPGVALLFRRHHDLLRDMIDAAWMRFIQSIPGNDRLLGSGQELGRFLFGTDRRTLHRIGRVLERHFGRDCFYCRRRIRGALHVDHFIPWSRYSLDLGHNFVLCDEMCNLDKGTNLPAHRHLRRWVNRNMRAGQALQMELENAGVPCDLETTHAIAEWAYGTDVRAHHSTWVGRRRRLERARAACVKVAREAAKALASPNHPDRVG